MDKVVGDEHLASLKRVQYCHRATFANERLFFHTYSTYVRGLDMLNTAYHYLDLVPKGRDEAGLPHAMAWVRLRDQYSS